jgi:hypothetical protein
MVHQARLDHPHNGRETGTVASIGRVKNRVAALTSDLITLTELQARLLYLDLREAGSKSAASLVALGALIPLTLGAVLVMLIGIGEGVAYALDWHRWAAYLSVGAVVALAAAVAGWYAFKRLTRVATVLSRSQQEFQANLEFVKSLFPGSDDPSIQAH